MLSIEGKVLGVESEERQGPTGSFVQTTIHIIDGLRVERVRVGRDFPKGEIPKVDETVKLQVAASAWVSKAGVPGFQLTALARLSGGLRAAAAS